ncbi:hypothetical protein DFH27DRAFT_218146 [Peziza echinospora]|nr:hypothetical protein DFH27DRAFT_218146 [Peziza echinospora]
MPSRYYLIACLACLLKVILRCTLYSQFPHGPRIWIPGPLFSTYPSQHCCMVLSPKIAAQCRYEGMEPRSSPKRHLLRCSMSIHLSTYQHPGANCRDGAITETHVAKAPSQVIEQCL